MYTKKICLLKLLLLLLLNAMTHDRNHVVGLSLPRHGNATSTAHLAARQQQTTFGQQQRRRRLSEVVTLGSNWHFTDGGTTKDGTWAGDQPFTIELEPESVALYKDRFCQIHEQNVRCQKGAVWNKAVSFSENQDADDSEQQYASQVLIEPRDWDWCDPCDCEEGREGGCPCDCSFSGEARSLAWELDYAFTCLGPVSENNNLIDPVDDFVRRLLYSPQQEFLCADSLPSMILMEAAAADAPGNA